VWQNILQTKGGIIVFTPGFWNMLGIGLCIFFSWSGYGVSQYLKLRKYDELDLELEYLKGKRDGFQEAVKIYEEEPKKEERR